jgi:hypothetical protein
MDQLLIIMYITSLGIIDPQKREVKAQGHCVVSFLTKSKLFPQWGEILLKMTLVHACLTLFDKTRNVPEWMRRSK